MKPVSVIFMYMVRQASCGFLAAALALPAHAAWHEIERFEDGVRIYVDDATAVQRDDNQAILRHLSQSDSNDFPRSLCIVELKNDSWRYYQRAVGHS